MSPSREKFPLGEKDPGEGTQGSLHILFINFLSIGRVLGVQKHILGRGKGGKLFRAPTS